MKKVVNELSELTNAIKDQKSDFHKQLATLQTIILGSNKAKENLTIIAQLKIIIEEKTKELEQLNEHNIFTEKTVIEKLSKIKELQSSITENKKKLQNKPGLLKGNLMKPP